MSLAGLTYGFPWSDDDYEAMPMLYLAPARIGDARLAGTSFLLLALQLVAAITHPRDLFICAHCAVPFHLAPGKRRPRTDRAIYCEDCSAEGSRNSKRQWWRQNRSSAAREDRRQAAEELARDDGSQAAGEYATPQQMAGWLGVSVPSIMAAIDTGELPALQFGEYVRINLRALGKADAGLTTESTGNSAPTAGDGSVSTVDIDGTGENGTRTGIPRPEHFEWLSEIRPYESFTYTWSRAVGPEPGPSDEFYHQAWRAMINFKGQTVSVLIGESKQFDRARLTIWVDGQPTGEFYETIDGQHWASLIEARS
jgi:excisionase family DNA binding protein